MLRKLTLAAALALGATLAAGPQSASAVTAGSPGAIAGAAAEGSMIVQVQTCRRVARICASRWGWGTLRFRRCMRIRGC
jgi:hypothetical protein